MKKKTIAASIASLMLCGSLVTGATFALFTSESETNIAINAGKVQMLANLQNLTTYSVAVNASNEYEYVKQAEGKFANGGTAVMTENELALDLLTPGDMVEFEVKLTNYSNVAIQYQTSVVAGEDNGLFDGLVVKIDGTQFIGGTAKSGWTALKANAQPDESVIKVSVELPVDAGNSYQEKSTKLAIGVSAVQGNANVKNDVLGDFAVATVEGLKTFAEVINSGDKQYAGKTIALTGDINLAGQEWTPINGWNGVLNGTTIEGNGYTISNMTVSGGESAGFIGNNDSNVTIKNVNFEGASVCTTPNKSQTYAGVVMGKNYSNITIENVTVEGCKVVNNWQCGGLVGFAEGNGPTFINCKVIDTFVGGYNCTAGAFFGLGGVDVVATNCVADDVRLYTDGLTWNSTQKLGGDYFLVGHLYGKTLTVNGCTVNCTVVSEYDK